MIKNKKILLAYGVSLGVAIVAIFLAFFLIPEEKTILLLRAQQQKATEMFEKSYDAGDTSPHIVNSLLTLYEREGLTNKTIQLLEKEIKENPDNFENYVELATLYKEMGMPASQMNALEAIVYRTNNAIILNEYSYLCHEFQMYDKEIEVLERMLANSKSNKEAVIRLAYLYYNAAEFQKSADLMRGFNFSNFPDEVTDRFYLDPTITLDFYVLALANIGDFDTMFDVVSKWVIPYERETVMLNLIAYLGVTGYVQESNALLLEYRKDYPLNETLFNALISGLTQVHEYQEAYDAILDRQPEVSEMTIVELNNLIRVLVFLNDRSENFLVTFDNPNIAFINEADLLNVVDILDGLGRQDIIEKININSGSRYLLLKSKIHYLLDDYETSKRYLDLVMKNASLSLWQRTAIIDILTRLGEVENAQLFALKTIAENYADSYVINQYLNYCTLNSIQSKCMKDMDKLSNKNNEFLLALLKINLYMSMKQWNKADLVARSLVDMEYMALFTDRTFEEAYENKLSNVMFAIAYKMLIADAEVVSMSYMAGALLQMSQNNSAFEGGVALLNEKVFEKDSNLDAIAWQKILSDNYDGVLKQDKEALYKYIYVLQKLAIKDSSDDKNSVLLSLRQEIEQILSYSGYNANTVPKDAISSLLYLGYGNDAMDYIKGMMEKNPSDWRNLYVDTLILAGLEQEVSEYLKDFLDNDEIRFAEKESLVYRLLQNGEVKIIMPLIKYMAENYSGDWSVLYVVNLQRYNLVKEINSYLDNLGNIEQLSPLNQQLLGYIFLTYSRKQEAENIFLRLAEDENNPNMPNTAQLLFLWGARPSQTQVDWIIKKAEAEMETVDKVAWLETLLFIRKPLKVIDIITAENLKGIEFVILKAAAFNQMKNKDKLNLLFSQELENERNADNLYKLGLAARELNLPELEVKILEKAYQEEDDNENIILELAQAYFNSADYLKSKKIIEENKDIAIKNYKAYYILGSIAFAEEKIDNSKIYYLKSAELYDIIKNNSLDDRIYYGYSLFRSGDIYGGINEFEKLSIDYPDNNYVKDSFYGLLMENGETEKARGLLK